MSEIRFIVSQVILRSLVFIDEICRGIEIVKGICIVGSVIESFDVSGCLGIVFIYFYGIFDLFFMVKNVMYKVMGVDNVEGQIKLIWKLIDGVCRESFVFEIVKREGVFEIIIQRVEVFYIFVYVKDILFVVVRLNKMQILLDNEYEISKLVRFERSLEKDLVKVIFKICGKKMIEYVGLECFLIGV